MKEPLWLTESFFYTANAELVQLYGGLLGTCREDVLHSTINRAKHLYHYQDSDLFDLAAAYGMGLSKTTHLLMEISAWHLFLCTLFYIEMVGNS